MAWSIPRRPHYYCAGHSAVIVIVNPRSLWPLCSLSFPSQSSSAKHNMCVYYIYVLVGGFNDLEKSWASSMGLGWHPIYEMENNPFMFETTYQYIYIWLYMYVCIGSCAISINQLVSSQFLSHWVGVRKYLLETMVSSCFPQQLTVDLPSQLVFLSSNSCKPPKAMEIRQSMRGIGNFQIFQPAKRY